MEGAIIGVAAGAAGTVLCAGVAAHIGMPRLVRKCSKNPPDGGEQIPPSATASRIRPPVRNDTRVNKGDKAGGALAQHRTMRRDGPLGPPPDTPSAPPRNHVLPPPCVAPTAPRCTTPPTPPPYPIQSSRRVPSPPPYALFERDVKQSSHCIGTEETEAPITTQPAATAIRV